MTDNIRPYAPGDGSAEPIPADAPLPPGSDAEQVVDDLDTRIRELGSDDVQEADETADAAEDNPDSGSDPGQDADAAQDPTDDGAEQDTPA